MVLSLKSLIMGRQQMAASNALSKNARPAVSVSERDVGGLDQVPSFKLSDAARRSTRTLDGGKLTPRGSD